MKIMLTGGATGGHFYPVIAVAEAIRVLEEEERLLPADLYFVSVSPYNPRVLMEYGIEYKEISTGKMRRYFSIKNFSDIFRTGFAILKALKIVYGIFPDVVFGKGGFASFPILFAARIFRIPVVIHESDATPGRVNQWAGKFARAIAVSYPEAAKYFPENRTVVTGNPIRKEILFPVSQGGAKFLHLEEGRPTILVLGGSQGSQTINEAILDALPALLPKYQIIHQIGAGNAAEIDSRLPVILAALPEAQRGRYTMHPYLDDLALRMAAGAADIIISRAGSSLFEIAAWGKPSILIPLSTKASRGEQKKNAFHYARTGAAFVIDESNLTPHLLSAEVERVMENSDLRKTMQDAAKKFGEHNASAAAKVAKEILRIAQEHER